MAGALFLSGLLVPGWTEGSSQDPQAPRCCAGVQVPVHVATLDPRLLRAGLFRSHLGHAKPAHEWNASQSQKTRRAPRTDPDRLPEVEQERRSQHDA